MMVGHGFATGQSLRCLAQTRHPGQLQHCTVELELTCPQQHQEAAAGGNEGGRMGGDASGGVSGVEGAPVLLVHFDTPVRDVAEGQAVAFYEGDVCLGGAVIRERAPTLWEEMLGIHRVGFSGTSRGVFISG